MRAAVKLQMKKEDKKMKNTTNPTTNHIKLRIPGVEYHVDVKYKYMEFHIPGVEFHESNHKANQTIDFRRPQQHHNNKH